MTNFLRQTHWQKSIAILALVVVFVATLAPISARAEEKKSATGTCTTRAVTDFALATLFKSVNAGAGVTKASFLGIKLPDVFPEITFDHTLNFWSCVNALLEKAAKVALDRFKKRLLDRISDDIIAWISDGRDPKFISNFGDFIEDAAQAAVGDTARAVGLAKLCSPLRARIPPLLRPLPKFSESVSCTLDDIVGNIEGFYEDFTTGGFLAYAEQWKPQNNPHGLFLKVKDQVMAEKAKKEEEAKLVASMGGGYKGVEECIEWTLSGTKKDDGKFYSQTFAPNNSTIVLPHITLSSFPYSNPYLPPDLGSPPYNQAAAILKNPSFECTKKRFSLPPAGTMQIASVPLQSQGDIQYLANAADLTPYLNAIFDAAVNRVIKEGVKALRGNPANLRSESGTGRTARTYIPPDPAFCRRTDLTEEQLRDCRYAGYGNEAASSTDVTAQMRNELRAQITDVRARLATASTSLTQLATLNLELIATTTALSECEVSRSVNGGIMCANTSSTLTQSEARRAQFALDHLTLTQSAASISEAETALNTDPNLGSSTLQEFVQSIAAIQSYLSITRNAQVGLEALLRQELTTRGQALRACQFGGYSCGWTPSP